MAGENKGVHTFPKGISLKVYGILQLEFKLVYYNIAVLHISHYIMWIASLNIFGHYLIYRALTDTYIGYTWSI